jgi:hypothetical protein
MFFNPNSKSMIFNPFVFHCSESCAQYYLCLWIVHSWLTLQFSLMFFFYLFFHFFNLDRQFAFEILDIQMDLVNQGILNNYVSVILTSLVIIYLFSAAGHFNFYLIECRDRHLFWSVQWPLFYMYLILFSYITIKHNWKQICVS